MADHPNALLLVRLFEAFGRRDGAALAGMFDHEVSWRVGGDNPMTGDYRGWRDVVRFLRRTTEETDGTYRSELLWCLADDERGVAVYRARGVRKAREGDVEIALLCRFSDGRIAEASAVPVDAKKFDEFWS